MVPNHSRWLTQTSLMQIRKTLNVPKWKQKKYDSKLWWIWRREVFLLLVVKKVYNKFFGSNILFKVFSWHWSLIFDNLVQTTQRIIRSQKSWDLNERKFFRELELEKQWAVAGRVGRRYLCNTVLLHPHFNHAICLILYIQLAYFWSYP